jgi:hypothetical protein
MPFEQLPHVPLVVGSARFAREEVARNGDMPTAGKGGADPPGILACNQDMESFQANLRTFTENRKS